MGRLKLVRGHLLLRRIHTWVKSLMLMYTHPSKLLLVFKGLLDSERVLD